MTGDLSQVGGEFIKHLIHEFGPSLTAMMLATRVGPDCGGNWLDGGDGTGRRAACGSSPSSICRCPRFLATQVMTLVLAVFGVLSAVLMGAFTAHQTFHVPYAVFLDLSKVRLPDVLTGVLKALAYGAAIPIVSGFCGLRTHGGSGVGWATTRAVVSSSFAVIVLDFLISALALLTWQAL